MKRWLPGFAWDGVIRRRQRSLAMPGWRQLADRIGPVDSVAVVGNAGYLGDLDQEALIDGTSLVIRMNNYRTAGFEPAVGRRCDVFLTNFSPEIDMTRPELAGVPRVVSSVPNTLRKSPADGLFQRHGENLADGMERLGRHEVFVPTAAEFAAARLHCGCVPSTGLMAVRLLLDHLRWRRAYITGFSFFRGREHYFAGESAGRARHDFERECRAIAALLAPLRAGGRIAVDPVMADHLDAPSAGAPP